MKNICCSIFSIILLCNCTNQTTEEILKNKIQGSWVDIHAKKVRKEQVIAPFKIPFGLNFQNDSVDFFKQFTKYTRDSLTNKMQFNAFAGFISYQIKADSLFITNPLKNNIEFKYTIDASREDTLLLKKNDTIRYTLERLAKPQKDTLFFDQIVLARSGCFGSCPIMNISVKKDGTVLFYGERFTTTIGLYTAKLSPQLTKHLFKKFENAQISKVKPYYSVGHSDDETVSTSFLKNGKIIKTVRDYGKAGTNELLWAYQSIENIYKLITLTTNEIRNQQLVFNHYYIHDKKMWLPLKKSESFILWNALQKAEITTKTFQPKFTLDFKKLRARKDETLKVETDGQFFKYYLKNGKTIAYDIGYNFITKNFTKEDFRELK